MQFGHTVYKICEQRDRHTDIPFTVFSTPIGGKVMKPHSRNWFSRYIIFPSSTLLV